MPEHLHSVVSKSSHQWKDFDSKVYQMRGLSIAPILRATSEILWLQIQRDLVASNLSGQSTCYNNMACHSQDLSIAPNLLVVVTTLALVLLLVLR